MITHKLIQGSPEWLAHRAAGNYFNASDAPAMTGCSKHKTRNQLLHELHTGIVPDVDPATQARFDEGHRIEALARPLAEDIIGEELYPMVGSNGKLSASFDGLTASDDICFEHKTLNEELRNVLINNQPLPLAYRVQMQQQLMVCGASKALFMASKWAGDVLVEEYHCWYYPDSELAAQIEAGWAQFEKDLAAYVPVKVAEKSQPDAIMTLPALAIQIRGEVVNSNLPAFRQAADSFIAKIKTELKTDDDFVNAKATVKFCEKAEKDLELAKSAAIAQTASIDELMRTVSHIQDQLRSKRLALDKLVVRRETEIKEEIVAKARAEFNDHVAALEAEIKPIKLVVAPPNFAAATKSKRTIASLENAVATELALGKIAADAAAKDMRAKLAWIKANAKDYGFLFSDLQLVIQKPAADFELLVTTRIATHKAAEAEKVAKAVEAAEAAKVAIAAPPAVTPAPTPIPKPARPTPAKRERPTDGQIITVLAEHFHVSFSEAASWINSAEIFA